MAAIYGCVKRDGPDPRCLTQMAEALAHRGDGVTDHWVQGEVALGSGRAAVHDREDRAAPYTSADGQTHVVLDGAILNRKPLRASLSQQGLETRSQSDAEIVAKLFESSGLDCFRLLRGPFAIAIWNGKRRELILARDHLGHKPVFYAETVRGFYFASETKALLAARAVPFEVDLETLSHFLSFRYVQAPHSLIKGVIKLAPSHALAYGNGGAVTRRFWAPSFERKHDLRAEEIVEGLDEKLRETVQAHLDDGSTGAFLSGGLDSGLIVANMARILQKPFPTFSLGVDDETDEVPDARLVARKFGTIAHEEYIKADFIRSLPAMIWHLDEPSDEVVVSKYLGARMAASLVDRVMSGDGGDELFAGFPRYLGVRDARYLSSLPAALRNGIIAPLAERLAGRAGIRTFIGKIGLLVEIAGAGELPERYAQAIAAQRFRPDAKRNLFTERVWQEVSGADSHKLLVDQVLESDADDPIEKLMYADFMTRLPEHLLMLGDRTGAAYGVEVRCPFADKELVEFTGAIPANMKLRGRKAKHIERILAGRMLPEQIVRAKKTGLRFPFAQLFAGALYPFLQSVFARSLVVEHGIFRSEYIDRLLEEHRRGVVDHYVRLWMLLCVEIWYRMMTEELHYEDMTPWMESHLAASGLGPEDGIAAATPGSAERPGVKGG
ncbi:MAG TPA: asparagine synthase (glutamine-hydrolyzing) [Gammaproteobacteria bacterium]